MFRANTPDIKQAEHMLPIKRTRRLMRGWVGVIRRSFSARRTSVCRTVMLAWCGGEGEGDLTPHAAYARTRTHRSPGHAVYIMQDLPTAFALSYNTVTSTPDVRAVPLRLLVSIDVTVKRVLFFLTFRCFESF